eukprot:359491-Chlamydomonas_euryale.AAC.1
MLSMRSRTSLARVARQPAAPFVKPCIACCNCRPEKLKGLELYLQTHAMESMPAGVSGWHPRFWPRLHACKRKNMLLPFLRGMSGMTPSDPPNWRRLSYKCCNARMHARTHTPTHRGTCPRDDRQWHNHPSL